MSITIPLSVEDTRKVSDGYHTFEELYQHRQLLFFAFAKSVDCRRVWKPHYPGWPVLFIELPSGQISYHFEEKYIPIVDKIAFRVDDYPWDGHVSSDVLQRIEEFLK